MALPSLFCSLPYLTIDTSIVFLGCYLVIYFIFIWGVVKNKGEIRASTAY